MKSNEYELFDARLSFGNPFMHRGNSVTEIVKMLKDTGISRAVAIMEEQSYCAPDTIIDTLNNTLDGYNSLYSLLVITPGCTGEIGVPEALIRKLFTGRMAGLLLNPVGFRIPLRPVFLKDWFETAQRKQIPIWYRAENDTGLMYIADVLEAFPKLYIILSFADEWPNNRKVYPLLSVYPNVYVCLSDLIWMGGVEDFVEKFGSTRLLFNTNYPLKYPGAAMLMLRNAEIGMKDKENIACKNLERILGGIVID